MELCNIKKVKQSYSDEEVNNFLAQGFELIKIISSRTVSMNVEEIRPCYILGLRENCRKHKG
jgi:hypothetical protein